ncbi:PBCV-specific basic adaptor domain-containing protein [Paramecium bursaria Chlorella virus CVR-1]|uniref:PBCV-specific basic adaptor domain-containing protein n=1 Tax=Paramecium bursaria Chlorella virus CVA-1 TaxID=42683 RepID=M1HJQ3_9PHYC|nr:PBCV-specific basic adaptor domain-containing protein [Paramecium bursaria Chlorella virus CVA-1]AGE50419.1 PBCV-specific basic adaptor domain-containing protein [Paramecium bursaria Chlorella virus CVA-1]AGE52097.1 PBCV-specific basic adaptor domain-containing protein [Paramecium bursaria Chlorella virus CVR-1]
MNNSIPTGTVNAKKRPVFKDSKGRTFVKEGSKKVYVKKLFMPTTNIAKSPMIETGKIDAKKRKVFKNSKGRTYVKEGSKKVYVKKLFTPERPITPVILKSPVADTGKINSKERRVLKDTKGRTYVKEGDKKVYVKKLFTPKVNRIAPVVRDESRSRKTKEPRKLLVPSMKVAPPPVVNWRSMLPEKFLCASRGLRQKTSTCWFNSALNGLVLSSASSKLLLEDMRKNLSKEEIRELSDMKVSDVCPKELSKKFVYAYALKIHDEFLQNKNKNESKNLVDKMFTPKALPTPVAQGEKGYYAIDAIHQLLRRVFPNKGRATIGMLEEAKRISNDTEFLVYDTVITKLHDIPPTIAGKFRLSHISYIVNLERTGEFHAVTAYICGRQKSIYDSNRMGRLDINWEVARNRKSILVYSGASKLHSIAYALYIKE